MDQGAFSETLQHTRLVAIIRGLSPSETANVAAHLWENGVKLLEIPLYSESSKEAFERALEAKSSHPGALLGVGSVRTREDYLLANAIGADFTVSPGLFPEVCAQARTDQHAHLPGVFTPTEIGKALALGFRTVKVFPASTHQPSGIQALTHPFPEAKIVAVGGVDPKNAPNYIAHGAAAVGMGTALTKQPDTIYSLLQKIVDQP